MHDSRVFYSRQSKQFQPFLHCDVLIVNGDKLLREYFHTVRGVVGLDVFHQWTFFYIALVKCLAGVFEHFDVALQLAQKLRRHLLQLCVYLLPKFSQFYICPFERIVLVIFSCGYVDAHILL